MAKNWNDDIIKQYIEAGEDFGFSAVNQDELSGFMAPKPNLEIDVIKAKIRSDFRIKFNMRRRIGSERTV